VDLVSIVERAQPQSVALLLNIGHPLPNDIEPIQL
jgi:hypothetical protein